MVLEAVIFYTLRFQLRVHFPLRDAIKGSFALIFGKGIVILDFRQAHFMTFELDPFGED